MVKKFSASIIKKEKIAEETFKVNFDIKNKGFSFKAGQYVTISLKDNVSKNIKENTRDFSISSSPNSKEVLTITFRVSESLFKQEILNSDKNSEFYINGPLGVFTLPDDVTREIIFIAGGIGITPFLSMINFATEEKLNYNITLVYTNSSPEKTVYLDELKKLEKQNSNFRLFSQFERVNPDFIKSNIKDIDKKLFYICGPPAMVSGTRKMLTEFGIEEKNILFEEFTGYK